MTSTLLIIWLLVAALIFVSLSEEFEPEHRYRALWLLAFAVCWPLSILYVLVGAIFALLLSSTWQRD